MMQVANVIHLVARGADACLSLGHIYLGTIGMEGAYERCAMAMSTIPGPRSTTISGTMTSQRQGARACAARKAPPRCRRAGKGSLDQGGGG